MISKATVFLNADKTQAVEEGSKDARFLLVRAGHDIPEQLAARYPGAAELIGAEPAKEEVKEGDTKPAPDADEVEGIKPKTQAAPKLHTRHHGK